MKIYYEETYSGIYEIDEINFDEAKKSLYRDLYTGTLECTEGAGSVAVQITGKGNPQFQIMGGKLDALDDNTKTFYLWHLMRYYYKKKLLDDKKKYEDEPTTVRQIDRLLNNIEEIDTLLCYDLF